MSDGFRVDDEALDAHARQVDALVGRMRVAADAGRPLDIGAYGLIGQVFAAAVAGATRNGSRSVGGLSEVVQGVADGLRAGRTEYLGVEQRLAASFGGPR